MKKSQRSVFLIEIPEKQNKSNKEHFGEISQIRVIIHKIKTYLTSIIMTKPKIIMSLYNIWNIIYCGKKVKTKIVPVKAVLQTTITSY